MSDLLGHGAVVPPDSFQPVGAVLAPIVEAATTRFHERQYAEPRGVREEMLSLCVQFYDVSVHDVLHDAVERALACRANCTVNPRNALHKIRDAFYELSDQGYISQDIAVRAVARMMSNAGDDFKTRNEVVQKLSCQDFSPLGL